MMLFLNKKVFLKKNVGGLNVILRIVIFVVNEILYIWLKNIYYID